VSAGSVKVEFLNSGEDPHDLHLRREDGTGGEFAFGSTASKARQTQALDLTPGYYYLWCALANHEAAGMHARLRVE
jgi:plastocyanin